MRRSWGRTVWPVRLLLAALACLLLGLPAWADDRLQFLATAEDGFGRIVLTFPGRLDLPSYKITSDNGVLSVTFADPVLLNLPDVGTVVPDYLTIGRVDPDRKGVRFGLSKPVTVHSMAAGEKLFIDLLPASWSGLPPSLPADVVAALTQRAKDAELLAEQKQRERLAQALNPQATLQVGRNPTFMRVEFDWNADTTATFKQDGANATITFDWPVAVDLYRLKSDLPAEITAASNAVSVSGSQINLTLADGVTPRFYTENPRQFTLDVDLTSAEIDKNQTTAEAAAKQAEADAAAAKAKQVAELVVDAAGAGPTIRAMQSQYTPAHRSCRSFRRWRAPCAWPSRSKPTRLLRSSGAATRCGCCLILPRRSSSRRSRKRWLPLPRRSR